MFKKFSVKVLIAFALATMFAPSSLAAEFFNGKMVVINSTVNDDAYVNSGKVFVTSDIIGDLYVAGGNVTVEGNISEDLFVAGGNVILKGTVGGDVKVVGGDISVYGNISDDLMLVGGNVNFSEESTVGGSVYAAGGAVVAGGRIFEDLKGFFEDLHISGTINGNVDVNTTESLQVDSGATISGNLKYTSPEAADVSGVVMGAIDFSPINYEEMRNQIAWSFISWKFMAFVSSVLLAALLLFLVPKAMMNTAKMTQEHFGRTLGYGILVFALMFIVPIVLAMTLVGLSLAFIVMAISFVMVVFAKVFAANFVTSYALQMEAPKKGSRKKIAEVSTWKWFAVMILVLFAYHLLVFIPIIGWITKALLFLIGLGSMVIMKTSYWKALRDQDLL